MAQLELPYGRMPKAFSLPLRMDWQAVTPLHQAVDVPQRATFLFWVRAPRAPRHRNGEESLPSPCPCFSPELTPQGQSGSDRTRAAPPWPSAAPILTPAHPKQLSTSQRSSSKWKQFFAAIPELLWGLWVDVQLSTLYSQKLLAVPRERQNLGTGRCGVLVSLPHPVPDSKCHSALLSRALSEHLVFL